MQASDGAVRFDGRPIGEDGAALSGEAERSWAERQGQPTFCGSGIVIARTGSPWRDLPAAFGHWNGVTRFRDWAKADVQKRLIGAVSDDPDMEYAMVGCYHRQGATATVRAQRRTQSQAIGRSKGGMTTKILALTDALGNLD
jgi:transposase